MRQSYLFSVLLHVIIVAAMAFSTPFRPHMSIDPGDVINVRLAALPAPKPEPVTIKPITIPQAIDAEEAFAVVPDIKTVDKAKPIKKKPKTKKREKPYQSKTDKATQPQAGADDTKDVSSNLAVGSKLGGAAIDNASFDYPYWYVQSFPKIERNWSNPVFANRPLKCVIYFQVIRSGKIIKIEIEQSSGVATYDRACKRAVKLSEPLPPLPKEFFEEILGIHLEFPYSP